MILTIFSILKRKMLKLLRSRYSQCLAGKTHSWVLIATTKANLTQFSSKPAGLENLSLILEIEAFDILTFYLIHLHGMNQVFIIESTFIKDPIFKQKVNIHAF